MEAPVVLFDGVCNLCNASVQFILKYEKEPVFKFATLQDAKAQKLIKSHEPTSIADSVLLVQDGKLYQESTAALLIARRLNYFWILYYLIYLPLWVRNPIYRFIARNRYRWFGKRESCMVPTEELKNRFL